MSASPSLSVTPPSFAGRIGTARTDITPPVGVYARNWGAARHDTASSIHRPLTATAVAISDRNGGPPLVLVDADLGWWRPLGLFHEFRERLLSELSLQPRQFLFALTHTHAAAPLMHADSALPGGDLLNAWLRDTERAIAAVIRQALAAQSDAVLDWQTGRCGLARGRDLPDPQVGATRYLCGFHPGMPADDTLLVGRVTGDDGVVRALFVNYACHPTTLAWDNRAISPDYIGAMRETVEQEIQAPAVFLQGNSGELAPARQYTADTSVADRHGRQLGFAALATLNAMPPAETQLRFAGTMESGAPLALWTDEAAESSTVLDAVLTTVELTLKDWPSAAELDQSFQECEDRAQQERLRRQRDIRRSLGDGSTFPLELLAWRIGDAVLVGTCCEAYSVLQQTLRQRYPSLAIASLNLINGSIGYLPPSELYDHDVYAVWQTPFQRGSLERLESAMSDVIVSLCSDHPAVTVSSSES